MGQKAQLGCTLKRYPTVNCMDIINVSFPVEMLRRQWPVAAA